jgi:hypothetical protein
MLATTQTDHRFAAGHAAATARIAAILNSEPAKGRGSLAHHLAFKTTLSAADAIATLQASPVETPTPTAGSPAAAWDDVVANLNATLRGNPHTAHSIAQSHRLA